MAASCKPLNDYFKVVVTLERRADGGLRAYSDDVPGFVLSHADPRMVLSDIKSALEGILSHMFEGTIIVEELSRLREKTSQPDVSVDSSLVVPTKEYVTHVTGP